MSFICAFCDIHIITNVYTYDTQAVAEQDDGEKTLHNFLKMEGATQGRRANIRLPPEVNRVLYVRNLPFKITAEEMYDIFGKYGAIRQIRL